MNRMLGVIMFGVAGCGRAAFDPVAVDASDPAVIDAPSCFGSLVRVCFAAPPNAIPLALIAPLDVDTDASPMCDQDNDKMAAYCVIVTADLSLSGGVLLRAHGRKPLVFVSTGTIHLESAATIDVSSRSLDPKVVGAGGNASTCVAGTSPGVCGGGYGGSFQGRGGRGQAVTTTSSGSDPPSSLTTPPELRGGCAGGGGSRSGAPGTGGGAGGAGGGAIALIAQEIRLDGIINASGSGGLGGPDKGGGGGGGGSGGMIVLDAPKIIAGSDVQLFANGGGGGEGSQNNNITGMSGGESLEPSKAGPGGGTGRPVDSNGDGGDGSHGPNLDGQDANDTHVGDGMCNIAASNEGGGGGGGGGAGFIHAPGVDPARISPPPT